MSRRAAAFAAALLAAAGCSRTKHVRAPDAGEGQRTGREEGGATGGRGDGIPAKPGRPPVPAAPQGLLEKGVVARIQRALGDRGLLKEHHEGELDAPTTAAVRRFQERQGLAATGFPDRETLKDLGIDPESAYVHEEDRKREHGEGEGQAQDRRGTGTSGGAAEGQGRGGR